MDTDYINKKISNIEKLLLNCTEDQKPIYQEYLEFWKEKIPKSKEKTDAETIEGEGNPLITTDEPPILEVTVDVNTGEVIDVKEADEPEEIIDIIEPELEALQAELFETTFPNKRAYLRRNGDLLKTKAFKEFLISKE